MLVREQTTFTGPHAQTLNRLGKDLYATYVPVHEFLQNQPSTAALPALTGGYEGIAQFQILTQEIAGWSARLASRVTYCEMSSVISRSRTTFRNIFGFPYFMTSVNGRSRP